MITRSSAPSESPTSSGDADRGVLALVLHTHMPYVEGFGTWPFGEEWLWEAVAQVYLPLLDTLRGVPLTLVLTPVLCDQLEALSGSARERFHSFLRDIRAPQHAQAAARHRAHGEVEAASEALRAAGDYVRADAAFETIDGDILGAIAELAASGGPELWTSSATHAILPLLATDTGLRLQVSAGAQVHGLRFGEWSGGFWLPECAYRPGLERVLAQHGVRAFCVDQADAPGRDSLDHLEPTLTAGGLCALSIDPETTSLVWNSPGRYPAAAAYRSYERATADGIHLWGNDARPYDHVAARALARAHARGFVAHVARRLDRYRKDRGLGGIVCVALDTEVLGHWWYEGQAWLSEVITQASLQGVELSTASAALERSDPVERRLSASSWGTPRDLTTWDSPAVADLACAARNAEVSVVRATSRRAATADAGDRRDALTRAARELLALQSSDWAYLESNRLAGSYPRERFAGHARALARALQAADGSLAVPDPALGNLAPNLDLSLLTAPCTTEPANRRIESGVADRVAEHEAHESQEGDAKQRLDRS
jgi:1,4-alpha-glucan branching enzyme